MPSAQGLAIQRLTLPIPTGFHAITPANTWIALTVQNQHGETPLRLRTDPDDKDTEYRLPIGESFTVGMCRTFEGAGKGGARFDAGQPALWVRIHPDDVPAGPPPPTHRDVVCVWS